MRNYEYYNLFLPIDPSKSYKLEPSREPAHSTFFQSLLLHQVSRTLTDLAHLCYAAPISESLQGQV